jgi:cytochrome c biogenesis protein
MSAPKYSLRSFFSSVRLTIVLLILIALFSVCGTLIPQQENAHEFMSRLSPATVQLLMGIQAFDIFHSYVFRALMALLSLNIIVCSFQRMAVSRRLVHAPAFPVPEDLFAAMEPERIIRKDIPLDEALLKVEAFLQRQFGRISKEERDGAMYFFGQKHRFAHWGVYVVHLSILVIILGALGGSFLGFEGYLNLDEGQSTESVELKGGGVKSLGFTVRCDRFLVEYYENGLPKTYRSDLSFIKDGRIARQGGILVNHPLSFEKIRFYQASYGLSAESRALLSYTKNGVKKGAVAVSPGAVFALAESKDTAMVLRVEENMMGMGPAVKLSIASSRGNVQFWVFKNLAEIKDMNPQLLEQMPLFNPGLFPPYVFAMNGMEEKYRTGIQVVDDPSLPIVIAGGFLLLIGLLVVFGMCHRRFWVCVDSWEGKTRIRLAGRSSGKQWGAEREVGILLANLCKEIK